MRTWVRTKTEAACGGPCRGRILAGAPMLIIEKPEVKRVMLRCATCAGESVPEVIPTAPMAPQHRAPIDMTRIGLLALDFSRQPSREPGEDG